MRKFDTSDVASLPPTPGSYLLIFEIPEQITVYAGRFGLLPFANFGSSDCKQRCVAHLVYTSDVTLDWASTLQEWR